MKNNYLYKILLTLSIIFWNSGKAQDAHWSMLQSNPIYSNPANAGFIEKNNLNRLSIIYRDQWRTIPVSYSSPYISYDRNVLKKNNHQLGIGAQLLYDRTSEGILSTISPSILAAYGIQLNDKNRLQFGLSCGLNFKKIQFQKLYFENQFNGTDFDTNLDSKENLNNENDMYLNLGSGLNYHLELADRKWLDVGLAFYNLTQPQYNILNTNIDVNTRIHAYVRSKWLIKDSRWAIAPSVLFQKQGKALETIVQTSAEVKLGNNETKPTYLSFGYGYRVVDAVIIYLGINWNNFNIAYSYDANISSSIKPATRKRGAYEIALSYNWGNKKVKE
jgi:type IX secretion system PorP/SprF family membrane protein